MKLAAAKALAALIPQEELSEENIIPSAFDKRVVPAIAAAVPRPPGTPAWPAPKLPAIPLGIAGATFAPL